MVGASERGREIVEMAKAKVKQAKQAKPEAKRALPGVLGFLPESVQALIEPGDSVDDSRVFHDVGFWSGVGIGCKWALVACFGCLAILTLPVWVPVWVAFKLASFVVRSVHSLGASLLPKQAKPEAKPEAKQAKLAGEAGKRVRALEAKLAKLEASRIVTASGSSDALDEFVHPVKRSRKPKQAKPEAKPEAKQAKQAKPEAKQAKQAKPEAKPEAKQAKPEAKQAKQAKQAKPEAKQAKPEAKQAKPKQAKLPAYVVSLEEFLSLCRESASHKYALGLANGALHKFSELGGVYVAPDSLKALQADFMRLNGSGRAKQIAYGHGHQGRLQVELFTKAGKSKGKRLESVSEAEARFSDDFDGACLDEVNGAIKVARAVEAKRQGEIVATAFAAKQAKPKQAKQAKRNS